MNEEYIKLKKEYEDITEKISSLYIKQGEIRELMEKACTHINVFKVYKNPFLSEVGVEDEETKYKCEDCYRYFTEDELEKLNIDKENLPTK